jgi:DNA-binding response OmpR family regulator
MAAVVFATLYYGDMNDFDIHPKSRGESCGPTLRGPGNPPRRILVVDDEATILRLTTLSLVHSGYDVDAAEDGAEAWEALQVKHYDLVITDNNMPNLSGVELIQKLHNAGMSLPVIMATGSPPEPEFTDTPWFHPVATLLKPYTVKELLETVEAFLPEIGNLAQQSVSRPTNPQPMVCTAN